MTAPKTQNWRQDIDADGLMTLILDIPGKSMNVLNQQALDELDQIIQFITTEQSVRGVVLTAEKESGFAAGADLNMLLTLGQLLKNSTMEDVFQHAFRMNKMFRTLETCGKPVACALNGLTLGGGLEMALACHYRVVADNPKIKLGLPEVQLGLLPGAGGTQRLPRIMGVQMALTYLLQGRNMSPQEALGFGVIHKIAPREDIVRVAKAWILDGGSPIQPWDQKKFKIPGGQGAFDPKIVQTFAGATAMVSKETKGNYPAATDILSCVYEGHQLPMDQAIALESKYFVKQIAGPVAQNMIRTLFVNKQKADKLAHRPEKIPATPCQKLGILGAGMMGAGIAYVAARAGIDCILLDQTIEAAEKGKAYSVNLLDKAVARKKTTTEKADALLARIHPTTAYEDLEGCDLVIEAVFEDIDIKANVTARTEAVISQNAIFASNTSTLPITGLARASQRPDQFIGLHFFSPVDKMPLVEIIMGKQTSPVALAKAMDFVKQLRKTPIVVNDSRGFYTTRAFMTYPLEAFTMLAEGINPALIENCGLYAGMAVGPFAVADEVSLELCHHILEATRKELGEAYRPGPVDDVINCLYVTHGRKGKKNNKGFYEYPADGHKYLWPDLSQHFPLADQQPTADEVRKRLLYRQTLEVIRCLEEDVVTRPEDADIGAILGWGFAPWTGGPLSMADNIGLDRFVAECDRMTALYGPAYSPTQRLRDMAKAGQTYYPTP
ncbi:MAG: 3-hydroxyacyl-CoA dehydrogenase [Kordiimonas sp.]|nr:3-hydroxyacyl-CoA dehydrogenase [Kordiimonas sp.]